MALTELRREETVRPKSVRSPLSVCCMTSGRRPDLLGGVLSPFSEVADEIVVAVVAERLDAVRAAVAGVADRVLAFPATAPADRPIAWLFRACRGSWILNVDDDEVPSPALLAKLPELLMRRDVTHMWIARRWLHPTVETFIGAAPWGTEFQLRLALADDRFLQFSDEFHRPVVCHGPSAYVEEPLWHLDTVLNPAAWRRNKAAAYERERPGMRFAGRAHNLGLYVPELEPELALTPVPELDRAAIAAALGFRALACRRAGGPGRLRGRGGSLLGRAAVRRGPLRGVPRARRRAADVRRGRAADGRRAGDEPRDHDVALGAGRPTRDQARLPLVERPGRGTGDSCAADGAARRRTLRWNGGGARPRGRTRGSGRLRARARPAP